jgi:hypothetical protein
MIGGVALEVLPMLAKGFKWLKSPVGMILILLVVFAGGAWLGHSFAKAKGDAALATLTAEHAVELADRWEVAAGAEREARSRYQARAEKADGLAAELAKSKAANAAESRTLKKEIAAYAAQTAALRRLSLRFVGLYNRAIRAAPAPGDRAVPAAPDPARPAGASGPADPADADSGLTEADLLDNADANGQLCNDIRDQLNRLIDLVESWKQEAR